LAFGPTRKSSQYAGKDFGRAALPYNKASPFTRFCLGGTSQAAPREYDEGIKMNAD